MNRWQCDWRGCRIEAVGVGSPVGLRAIGWYFDHPDPDRQCVIFCPAHRPDPAPCNQEESTLTSCEKCAGEREARGIQQLLPRHAANQPHTTNILAEFLAGQPGIPRGGMGGQLTTAELADLMQRVNTGRWFAQGGDPVWFFLGNASGWEICVYPEFQPQLGVIHRCGYQLPLRPDGLRGTYLGNALVELMKHLPEHNCAEMGRDRYT